MSLNIKRMPFYLYYIALLMFFYGCNTLLGYRPISETRYKYLYIPTVRSTSVWGGFEWEFTEALKQELFLLGGVTFTDDVNAELKINISIIKLGTEPIGYRVERYNTPIGESIYSITDSRWLVMDIELAIVENSSSKILWKKKEKDKEAFYLSEDPLELEYNRKKAMLKIAKRTARKVHEFLLPSF